MLNLSTRWLRNRPFAPVFWCCFTYQLWFWTTVAQPLSVANSDRVLRRLFDLDARLRPMRDASGFQSGDIMLLMSLVSIESYIELVLRCKYSTRDLLFIGLLPRPDLCDSPGGLCSFLSFLPAISLVRSHSSCGHGIPPTPSTEPYGIATGKSLLFLDELGLDTDGSWDTEDCSAEQSSNPTKNSLSTSPSTNITSNGSISRSPRWLQLCCSLS